MSNPAYRLLHSLKNNNKNFTVGAYYKELFGCDSEYLVCKYMFYLYKDIQMLEVFAQERLEEDAYKDHIEYFKSMVSCKCLSNSATRLREQDVVFLKMADSLLFGRYDEDIEEVDAYYTQIVELLPSIKDEIPQDVAYIVDEIEEELQQSRSLSQFGGYAMAKDKAIVLIGKVSLLYHVGIKSKTLSVVVELLQKIVQTTIQMDKFLNSTQSLLDFLKGEL